MPCDEVCSVKMCTENQGHILSPLCPVLVKFLRPEMNNSRIIKLEFTLLVKSDPWRVGLGLIS